MKKLTIIAFLIISTIATWAQRTYDADFTQIKVTKGSETMVEKAGHLVFDGAENLVMTYSQPEGESFIIEGNLVKINMDGKNVVLNADKLKSVGSQRATLLNCMAGNWEQAAIDNDAETTIIEEDGNRTIFIDARGAKKTVKGGYITVTVTYRIADGALLTMILEQKNGVINTYEMIYN